MKKLFLTLVVLISVSFVFTGCKDTTGATDKIKTSFLDGIWVYKNEDGIFENKIEIEDMKYEYYLASVFYKNKVKYAQNNNKSLPKVKWATFPKNKGDVYLKGNTLILSYEINDEECAFTYKVSDDKKSLIFIEKDENNELVERSFVKE